jgi:Fe2+ or Zn2+ uptake regulation protein
MVKAKEYSDILSALSKRNMTVKEIHELYKGSDGKYAKTLKTVYRHLDSMEQLDLVMLAGHRKYEGARSVEKLYTRTAKVFADDQAKQKEWLVSEEGQQFLDSLTDVLWLLKRGKGNKEKLRKHVQEYCISLQDQTNELIHEMANDEKFGNLIENNSFDNIKGLLEIAPPILAMLESPEITAEIKRELY